MKIKNLLILIHSLEDEINIVSEYSVYQTRRPNVERDSEAILFKEST